MTRPGWTSCPACRMDVPTPVYAEHCAPHLAADPAYLPYFHGDEDGVPVISYAYVQPDGAIPATDAQVAAYEEFWRAQDA